MLVNSKSRRAFIKGCGSVLIGLPFLEELVGKQAFAAGENQYNYLTAFFGLGVPKQLTSLSQQPLSPLKPFSDAGKLSCFQLSLPNYMPLSGGGNHEGVLPHIAIARPAVQKNKLSSGPSLDYFLYQQTDNKPPVDLAATGNSILNINDQTEFTRSYRAPGKPVAPVRSPIALFEELFGKEVVGVGNTKSEPSIIVDSVVDQYKYLMSDRSRLSGEAKNAISDTLDEIEQMQKTLNSTLDNPEFSTWYAGLSKPGWAKVAPTNPKTAFSIKRGQGANPDRAWVLPLLADILVLGLKLGVIRFGSYAVTAGAERAVFGKYKDDLHNYYHKDSRKKTISPEVAYYIEYLLSDIAYLLTRLDAEPHLDGTLLDYTSVLITTELERHHYASDMFWAVAGGPFKHKKAQIKYAGGTDTDLYNTIAHANLRQEMPDGFNPDKAHIFGDSRGFNRLITEIL